MKHLVLIAALFAATISKAQLTLIDITGAAEFNLSQRDFPGIPQQYTQMKFWIPSPTQTGDIVWYTFNPTFNASKVLSGYAYNDINSGYPITDETRISNFTQNGNSYTYTIELNDGGMWTLDSRQTVYYDVNGNDSIWLLESHNGMSFDVDGRAVFTFNNLNQFTNLSFQEWDGTEFIEVLTRSITYNGIKRIEDIQKVNEDGFEFEFASNTYFYDANNRVDSILYEEFDEVTLELEPRIAYKIKNSNGTITDIKAYEKNEDFEYVWRTTFTGGTSGLNKNQILNTRIYPNPASNNVTIQLNNSKSAQVEVFDFQGKSKLVQQIGAKAEINTQPLANGIYLFVITDKDGKIAQHRVVIGE